jgi:hypothetical protein
MLKVWTKPVVGIEGVLEDEITEKGFQTSTREKKKKIQRMKDEDNDHGWKNERGPLHVFIL